MPKYNFINFMLTDNVSCVNNYPIEEYQEYLDHFSLLSFEYSKEVKCLRVELTPRSNSRIANLFLYSCTLDDLMAYTDDQCPGPIGHLQLTLWKGLNPEIKNIGITYE